MQVIFLHSVKGGMSRDGTLIFIDTVSTNAGGGHAFIGLHLAKQLMKDGHSVTILNDGDEVCSLMDCNL